MRVEAERGEVRKKERRTGNSQFNYIHVNVGIKK
jgi:hypothetical protein